jgi:hypothetical protein
MFLLVITHTAAVNVTALIEQQFEQRDPHYLSKKAAALAQVTASNALLQQREAAGAALPCSEQKLIDAKHTAHYTDDWSALSAQLAAFNASLAQSNQSWALNQSAADGAWGACSSRLSARFDAASTAVNTAVASGERRAQYPLRWTAPIASPAGLGSLLDTWRVSDIASSGADVRDDLGGIVGAVTQFVYKPPLAAFVNATDAAMAGLLVIDDAYARAVDAYLDAWQDDASGFWGAAYVDGDRVVGGADLSMTYHVVSYRGGVVARWEQIVWTLTSAAYQSAPYPYGWRHGTTVPLHNGYDVAKLLKLGWKQAPSSARPRISASLAALVSRSLAEEVNATAGTLRCDPTFYNSIGDCYYFGASFLHAVAYFTSTSSAPWWSADPATRFPGGPALCAALRATIVHMGLRSDSALAALDRLQEDCPVSSAP